MSRSQLVSAIVAVGASFTLGCGSGSGPTTVTPPPPPPTGALSGRLVDDPVEGVTYVTTSGVTGVTGPNGEYSYNAGDRVSFKLGTKVLAAGITATGIITPVAMAANATILQNLLVLLQSLDADGNPLNGIRIPQGSRDAVDSTLNLGLDPSVFASSANTVLVKAQQAGGITTGITAPAQASSTFRRQFLQLFALRVWASSDATTFLMFRADTSGNYLMTQAAPSELGGHAGIEAGKITSAGFDTFGWMWSKPTLTIDTNGQWGLSDLLPCERVQLLGDFITSTDCTGAAGGSVTHMENNATSIVGAWALGSTTNVQVLTLFFFSNGKFGVVDPTGSTATPSCGGPGVEYGSYTYDATTKLLKVSNLQYNTNGCAGLSGTTAAAAGLTFTLSSDGATATYNDGAARTVYRVSQ